MKWRGISPPVFILLPLSANGLVDSETKHSDHLRYPAIFAATSKALSLAFQSGISPTTYPFQTYFFVAFIPSAIELASMFVDNPAASKVAVNSG